MDFGEFENTTTDLRRVADCISTLLCCYDELIDMGDPIVIRSMMNCFHDSLERIVVDQERTLAGKYALRNAAPSALIVPSWENLYTR
jgi:hypothetical protein